MLHSDIFLESEATVAAPLHYIFCTKDKIVKFYKATENENPFPCPSGYNLLGYLLLRQGSEYLKNRFGVLDHNEILSFALDEQKATNGKVLIVNLMGEKVSVMRALKGMADAEIISPKNETELNNALSQKIPNSFDLIVVNTHGTGAFGNKKPKPIKLEKMQNFNLLAPQGSFVHLGCKALSKCYEAETRRLYLKLSERLDAPIFGSESNLFFPSTRIKHISLLAELLSKPVGNLFEISAYQTQAGDTARVIKSQLSGCRVRLK